MDVYPLAVTQPEWQVLVNVCNDVLGLSPTRGLDLSGMAPSDPAAFLASLDLKNDPKNALRNPGPVFRHYMISFIAVCDDYLLQQLGDTEIKVSSTKGRREWVAILSANMLEWYRTILWACRKESEYELRACMNLVVAHLERAGFREIFSSFEKHQLGDGTFVLRT